MSMVSVNLTIVVQIFDFFVAYVIIRNLLLRPVLDVIEQEQQKQVQTLKTIDTYLRSNGAKEDTIARRWQSCQNEFIAQSPHITHQLEIVSATKDMQHPPEIPDNATIEKLAATLAHTIAHEVRHVR